MPLVLEKTYQTPTRTNGNPNYLDLSTADGVVGIDSEPKYNAPSVFWAEDKKVTVVRIGVQYRPVLALHRLGGHGCIGQNWGWLPYRAVARSSLQH